MDSVEESGAGSGAASSLGRGAYAVVRGWALHEGRHEPLDALLLSLGIETPVVAFLGLPRPDVAERFGPASLNAGFVAVLPLTAPLGEHRLALEAWVGDEVLSCDASCSVSIDAPGDPFKGRRERSALWAYAIDGVQLRDGTLAITVGQDAAVLSWGSPASIKLWAIDLAQRTPPDRIVARSGGVYLRVIDGLMRRDAAASVGAPEAVRCGFAVPVSPSLSGTESVELFALDSGDTYARLGTVSVRRPDALPLSALARSGRIRGRIESVALNGLSVSATDDIVAAPGSVLTVRGWAVDEVGPRRTGGVFADVGGMMCEASYGGIRHDVAAALDAPGIAECEFQATIDTTSLSLGRHRVAMFALTGRRDARGAFGTSIVVNVRKSSET